MVNTEWVCMFNIKTVNVGTCQNLNVFWKIRSKKNIHDCIKGWRWLTFLGKYTSYFIYLFSLIYQIETYLMLLGVGNKCFFEGGKSMSSPALCEERGSVTFTRAL